MRRLLALSLLALALASCAPSQTSTTTTVSVGLSLRFGVRVSDIITDFRPTRGNVYLVGERIEFLLTARRPGYVTLVFYDALSDLQALPFTTNIRVGAGTNIISTTDPGFQLAASTSRGRTLIRAYFTPTPSGGASFSGRVTIDVFNSRGALYLNPYPENARDVAETYIDVR